MKSDHYLKRSCLLGRILLVLLAAAAGSFATHGAESTSASGVALWDTITPLGDTTPVAERSNWKRIPSDLLSLEAVPAKAVSDPSYYGREVVFAGDVVIENRSMAAVFLAGKGRVLIYSKDSATSPHGALGKKIAEFVPFQGRSQPARIDRCELVRNAGDEVVINGLFSAKGAPNASAVFSLGRTGILDIKPAPGMKGMRLLCPIEYGIVPGYIGDDLILSPSDYPAINTLNVLPENLFIGLAPGEDRMLAMTWPAGRQQMRLELGKEENGRRLVEAIDFDNDGQSLHLAALAAPGIWHKETLTPAYLEKAVTSEWKRPFPAKWRTQLYEGNAKTAFTFREAKGTIWRGVPGSYNYPAWFDGDTTCFFLGKKVPPKGNAVVYFLEGNDTPLQVSTPIDIMKATLGRTMSDNLLDIAGRKPRSHHRRGGDGIRRACTCGCTEAIQAVFEAGDEISKKDYIGGALEDMVFFVQAHVARIDEYRRFADEMIAFLRAKQGANPALKPYLENMEQIIQQIPQEYTVQKENMKSLKYAEELTGRTLALASKKDSQNLAAYMELLKAWRGMGGAQDYVLAQCHTVSRKLFQEAGYGCVNQPGAIDLAKEIRGRCRQILRNPDGYEIWPEYY